MSAPPASRRATYDDLLKVPKNVTAELVDGELYTTPRPAKRHALAHSALLGTLLPPYQFGSGGPGGWVIITEPELHLDCDVLVPDIGGWRTERWSDDDAVGMDFPPDWVCEVISPSTGRFDRVKKMPVYARHGVSYLWLVAPEPRTLEAFKLANNRWLSIGVYGGDTEAAIEPFDDIVIPLARLWLGPDPYPET